VPNNFLHLEFWMLLKIIFLNCFETCMFIVSLLLFCATCSWVIEDVDVLSCLRKEVHLFNRNMTILTSLKGYCSLLAIQLVKTMLPLKTWNFAQKKDMHARMTYVFIIIFNMIRSVASSGEPDY
jgi:hypothetical protein